jgi:outer membrane protein OmpA-like peptidoglycan-associated protein
MAKHQQCKCEEAECECPEWIFTFADMVMLMMGLFVIMWVLKPAPGKPQPEGSSQVAAEDDPWLSTVADIRSGFGWMPDPTSSDPVDRAAIHKRLRMRGPGQGGRTELLRKGAEGTDPEVTSVRPGQQAIVGGRVLFDAGQATLTSDATDMLQQIADQIRGHRNIVLVKGHTSLDDLGDATTAEQKMDLSLRRAQTAAAYLATRGVAPDILRVQGCSTFEPVVQHTYTPNAQATNRRVEVEATSTLVAERQDVATPAPASAYPADAAPTTSPETQPADTSRPSSVPATDAASKPAGPAATVPGND